MQDQNYRLITITVPDDFAGLCHYDLVSAAEVLQTFARDISGDPGSTSKDCSRAWAYYDKLHGWRAMWLRQNVPDIAAAMFDSLKKGEEGYGIQDCDVA